MILNRHNMKVVTAEFDKASSNHWYKIIVELPQLHLESPNLNTTVYAHELIDMIEKESRKCPNCNMDL